MTFDDVIKRLKECKTITDYLYLCNELDLQNNTKVKEGK